jgi:hypothetical protein
MTTLAAHELPTGESWANGRQWYTIRGAQSRGLAVLSGFNPFEKSDTTTEQDMQLWTEEENSNLAFRVAEPKALNAHKLKDIMWDSMGLTCIGATTTFLAAKDGPPNMASFPGWLGMLDLFLFTAGLVPSMLGAGPSTLF